MNSNLLLAILIIAISGMANAGTTISDNDQYKIQVYGEIVKDLGVSEAKQWNVTCYLSKDEGSTSAVCNGKRPASPLAPRSYSSWKCSKGSGRIHCFKRPDTSLPGIYFDRYRMVAIKSY